METARSPSRHPLSALPWVSGALIVMCSGIPLLWLVWQVLTNGQTLSLLRPTAIRWDILGRTCGFSAIAAAIAIILAIPAGLTLGRRRGWTARLIGLLLPVTLLLPSLTYAYGWAQFFRLISSPLGRLPHLLGFDLIWLRDVVGINIRTIGPDAPAAFLVPAGPADVARCIASLAAWLWPIPAAAMAWSLRRADPAIREQAMLDNAEARVTFRQLLGPALAGGLAVWMLAGQEFAVYEPTGISVVATEVRMVFETGSFSSAGNPITQPMGGSAMFGGDQAAGGGDNNSGPAEIAVTSNPRDVQQRAAAAAVATGVPMLVITGLLGALAAMLIRRGAVDGETVQEGMLPPSVRRGRVGEGAGLSKRRAKPKSEISDLILNALADERSGKLLAHPTQSPLVPLPSPPPEYRGRELRRPTSWKLERTTLLLTFVVLVVTVGIPIISLVLRHQRKLDLLFAWKEFGDLLLGSLAIAGLTSSAAAILAMGATIRRPKWGVALALATFLIGGQLLAIALIRLYNQPGMGWISQAPPIMVLAYLGRFGWLPLMAARATWSRPWRDLRAVAAVDGAGAGDIAASLVWPLAWPLIAGSAVLVLVLSLTEVPATVLASPFRPPQIIPMLMTWVHTLDNDPMIEASLLMVVLVVLLSIVGLALMSFRRPRMEGGRAR